ncbi:hypothetical protein ALTER154_100004 [Alteromonas sp. 154]|nr:hypothetical protein ALTER154_100004 [Alteromonas sp. 154]
MPAIGTKKSVPITFELKAADLHLPQARAMLIRKGEGSCTGIFIKPNEV